MTSQILTPFDVTGSASAATRQVARAARPARTARATGPALGGTVAWLLVSAAAGLVAAAAAAAWMVDSVHLF